MPNPKITHLVSQYLKDQCKRPEGKVFGLLHCIPENFGAVVIGERMAFIQQKGNSFWSFPPLFLVDTQQEAVYKIPIQYAPISDIKTITLNVINKHQTHFDYPNEIKDLDAYKTLLKVIKERYPEHPKFTQPPPSDFMPQAKIVRPPNLDFLDSMDLDTNLTD